MDSALKDEEVIQHIYEKVEMPDRYRKTFKLSSMKKDETALLGEFEGKIHSLHTTPEFNPEELMVYVQDNKVYCRAIEDFTPPKDAYAIVEYTR